jgi:hypothetical protein
MALVNMESAWESDDFDMTMDQYPGAVRRVHGPQRLKINVNFEFHPGEKMTYDDLAEQMCEDIRERLIKAPRRAAGPLAVLEHNVEEVLRETRG